MDTSISRSTRGEWPPHGNITPDVWFELQIRRSSSLHVRSRLFVSNSSPSALTLHFVFFVFFFCITTSNSPPPPKLLFSTISHTSCHLIEGHRLSHLSTSLLLYHPLASKSIAPSLGSGLSPEHPCLAPSSCPLDPLGGYILQASLVVQDVNKPELMTRGINELMALKEILKGVVDINVGDRLSLDTRVKEHLESFGSIK